MKYRQFFISIFVISMLVFNLAACAGTPASNTTSTPDTIASSAQETTSKQPTGGKTINYWAMWSETEIQAEVFKEAIARYEAATGNTVKVNWLGRDVRLTLKSAIDSGEFSLTPVNSLMSLKTRRTGYTPILAPSTF